jgi:2-alkyl-3-oxoalkanoate reductase
VLLLVTAENGSKDIKMRILIAGAGGAIGQPLIVRMQNAGHTVAALTRSESKRESLAKLGATVFIVDALNAAAVEGVVQASKPDVIVNQLTAIPPDPDFLNFDREFEATNRLRTEGSDNLNAAAMAAGVQRMIAQSFSGSPYARTGSMVKSEEDPFDNSPPKQFRKTFDALRYLESAVITHFPTGGIVLRYGWLYGPGTALSKNGAMAEAVTKRMLPIVAGGAGLWSFIHVEDAAAATVAALDAPPGIYNIVDDEPALTRDWISLLAKLLGAKPPLELPAWAAKPLVGDHGLAVLRDNRGASNHKAKQTFAWKPSYPSWKDGFRAEFETGAASHT